MEPAGWRTVLEKWGMMSTPITTTRVGLAVALAATMLSGCGPGASPGGSPSATAAPSATATTTPDSSPSPAVVEPAPTGGGLAVELRPADEIPWDEVGPGWFLLGYDPERATPGEESWDDGWVLGTGETWLLSPEGVAYRGPRPPAGAEWVSLWSGTEVWFAVPDWADEGHPEQVAGEVVSVDVLSGEQGHPWGSETLPQALAVTASGSLLDYESCCDASDVTLIAEDGTAIHVASGDHTGPTLDGLTPDGTAFVWAGAYYKEGDPESSNVWMSDLAGGETTLATVGKIADDVGWIDETTMLLDTYHRGDDWTPVDREFLAVDVTTGATSPWDSPVEDFDYVSGLSPGTWLWSTSESSGAVVTNNDGSMRVSLACGCNDYCIPYVSGNRMLWFEQWKDEAAAGEYLTRPIGQRVTLVNLVTGEQTIIFEGGLPGGILDAIAPHANTYD